MTLETGFLADATKHQFMCNAIFVENQMFYLLIIFADYLARIFKFYVDSGNYIVLGIWIRYFYLKFDWIKLAMSKCVKQ